ncbi:MAG: AAA family ATPase [Cardiobacteriaceae bacterium]|nr:AAA family ATPase [Cardiobacteriaceae bacterium]
MEKELKKYIEKHHLTQAEIAQKLGVSVAAVNQYLQNKYQGDVSKLDKAVVDMIKREKLAKESALEFVFVKTKTAARILEIVGLAHAMNECHVVIGEAGLGKTVALKHYAENHSHVIMLEIDPTYTAKTLLKALCEKLGLRAERTNAAMLDAVVEKLKDSNRLIIVDEAELLAHQPLEILRRIHDKAGVGLVLAGMPRLRANLRGSRGEYKQLYSRVGCCLDLKDKISLEDCAQIAQSALQTSDFNQELYKFSKGNTRRLSKLLKGVYRLSMINQRPIESAFIERYAQMLID